MHEIEGKHPFVTPSREKRASRERKSEDEPHACAVTNKLRIQGQPMTPDTVADGAGEVGEMFRGKGCLVGPFVSGA